MLLLIASLPYLAYGDWADIRTNKPVYMAHEPVVVEFSGFPGNAQDWITVISASEPADQYGEWFYLEGQTSGRLSFKGLAPGRYEARGYFNWPEGGYNIQCRYPFEVR